MIVRIDQIDSKQTGRKDLMRLLRSEKLFLFVIMALLLVGCGIQQNSWCKELVSDIQSCAANSRTDDPTFAPYTQRCLVYYDEPKSDDTRYLPMMPFPETCNSESGFSKSACCVRRDALVKDCVDNETNGLYGCLANSDQDRSTCDADAGVLIAIEKCR